MHFWGDKTASFLDFYVLNRPDFALKSASGFFVDFQLRLFKSPWRVYLLVYRFSRAATSLWLNTFHPLCHVESVWVCVANGISPANYESLALQWLSVCVSREENFLTCHHYGPFTFSTPLAMTFTWTPSKIETSELWKKIPRLFC